MSQKFLRPRRLLPALIVLLLLVFAAQAGASPAGAGVRPFAEGEEPPTIATPEDQHSVVGPAVSLDVTGTEMVSLKAEGTPLVLSVEKVTLTLWHVTLTPTTPTPATTVVLTAENSKLETVKTEFSWTVAGINSPGDQTTVVNGPVKVPVTGVELATLTDIEGKLLLAGLSLSKTSESEWQIEGLPKTPSEFEVELKATTPAAGAPSPVKFKWTIDGIDNPGALTGTVGVPLSVPITGVGLHKLVPAPAKPLPPGLELESGGSETEWRIVGTPTKAGPFEVEIEGEGAEGKPLRVAFTWTIAEAPPPPPPTPPSATGTLTISPAAAFSAARATCSGLTWSASTVSTQWLLDGMTIAGATSATYVAPRMNDGRRLSCRQTAVAANGASASLTSAPATVHEQPPQPYWPIGSASQRCSSPVCMQDGEAPQTAVTRTYQQDGSWSAASQVRCVSAPWTSIAGTSGLAAVESLAEAHAVTVTLTRTSSAGTETVISQELNSLTAASEGIDGAVPGSPFAGNIVTSFGSQPFAAGELWPRLFPGSLGKADRFVAGQGYIAYQLAAGAGVVRSFQLVYNLTAADVGAHLRCSVSAKDGPPASPTTASIASPEYTVLGARSCAPRRIAHIGGPQPFVVVVGTRLCLEAPSGLAEIGNGPRDVSVVAGRSAVALECTLASGCSGKLTLNSGGAGLASATVAIHRGSRKVVSLKLTAQGRARLKKAGSRGLAASLNLAGKASKRRLASVKLLAAP